MDKDIALCSASTAKTTAETNKMIRNLRRGKCQFFLVSTRTDRFSIICQYSIISQMNLNGWAENMVYGLKSPTNTPLHGLIFCLHRNKCDVCASFCFVLCKKIKFSRYSTSYVEDIQHRSEMTDTFDAFVHCYILVCSLTHRIASHRLREMSFHL